MINKDNAGREYMPLPIRKPFLIRYYAGTDFGKLHIWTHEKIASNGWLDYAWWGRVNGDILIDMENNSGTWKNFLDFLRTYGKDLDTHTRLKGAHIWWTAHNTSLQAARRRNDEHFRLMPFAVQERTGLMIEGALAWQIDGLRPWSIPSKWMRIFM